MAAIRARRRHFLAAENIFENVRVEIRAEPAQGVKLKAAARDVGVKRGEFEGAQIKLHSDAMPLSLQSGGEQSRGFVGGSFQFEMEANAIGAATESGGVEKGIGARGIEIVVSDIPVIGPVIRRQQTIRSARLAAQKVADESLTIGGVGESRAGCVRHFEIRVASQRRDCVRRKGIQFEVPGAFAKFERANERIRNDAEADTLERRRAAKIIWVALDDDFLVRCHADEAKGTRADGMLREVRTGILRDNADGLARAVQEERRIGYTKVKNNGPGIGRGDGVDELDRTALRRSDRAGDDGLESEF